IFYTRDGLSFKNRPIDLGCIIQHRTHGDMYKITPFGTNKFNKIGRIEGRMFKLMLKRGLIYFLDLVVAYPTLTGIKGNTDAAPLSSFLKNFEIFSKSVV